MLFQVPTDRIFETTAGSILSPVSGFLAEAGYTHSLNPARNCTFGCSYCYVPTMRVQAGLKPEDWRHWGEWTTFKSNAADLLRRALRPHHVIYCSPLTDPYQPAEQQRQLMPAILEEIITNPPKAFVLQTRGPLILRDLELLRRIPCLRVSFSITTDRDEVLRVFESRCAPVDERFRTVEQLTAAGIRTSVAVAPILPCDPEALARRALAVSSGPLVADPLHTRENKSAGATTRSAAVAICDRHGWTNWLSGAFQQETLTRIERVCAEADRPFGFGPPGFGLLASSLS